LSGDTYDAIWFGVELSFGTSQVPHTPRVETHRVGMCGIGTVARSLGHSLLALCLSVVASCGARSQPADAQHSSA